MVDGDTRKLNKSNRSYFGLDGDTGLRLALGSPSTVTGLSACLLDVDGILNDRWDSVDAPRVC